MLDPRIDWPRLVFEHRIVKNAGPYKEIAHPFQRYLDWSFANFLRLYHQLPRGCDKTECRAFWTLLWGKTSDHGQCFATGVDKDNARLFRDAAKWIVKAHPHLFSEYKVHNYDIINKKNQTHIRVIPADAAGNYGLTPDLLLVNDFHAWDNEEYWQALYTAMGKRKNARIWIESNALALGTPQVQWIRPLRQFAQEQFRSTPIEHDGWRVTRGPKWFFYSPGHFPASWQWSHVAEWKATLHPQAFNRLILNQDTTDGQQYLTEEQVKQCIVSQTPIPPVKNRNSIFAIGVDLGITKDAATRATVSISRTSKDIELVLHSMSIWPGSRADPVSIRNVVKDANSESDLVQATYKLGDPYEMRAVMQEDSSWEEFNFNPSNVRKITEFLYSAFATKQIKIYSNVAPCLQSKSGKPTMWNLEHELQEAVLKEATYGHRVDHKSTGFTDRIMALGM